MVGRAPAPLEGDRVPAQRGPGVADAQPGVTRRWPRGPDRTRPRAPGGPVPRHAPPAAVGVTSREVRRRSRTPRARSRAARVRGDGGLGDAQGDRRVGEGALVHDGHQTAQLAQLYVVHTPRRIDRLGHAFCAAAGHAHDPRMRRTLRRPATAEGLDRVGGRGRAAVPGGRPGWPPWPAWPAWPAAACPTRSAPPSARWPSPVLGPVGVVAVRRYVAALVLLAVARPRLRAFTWRQWWPVLLLGGVFGTMNLEPATAPPTGSAWGSGRDPGVPRAAHDRAGRVPAPAGRRVRGAGRGRGRGPDAPAPLRRLRRDGARPGRRVLLGVVHPAQPGGRAPCPRGAGRGGGLPRCPRWPSCRSASPSRPPTRRRPVPSCAP